MIRANDVSISSCKIIIFILLMLAVVVATATTLELSTIRNHRVCHHLAFSTRVGERKQSHFSPSTLSNTINYRIIRGHQHHKNNIISSPKYLSISSMKMSHNTSPIQKKFKLSQVILDRNDDDDTDKQLVQDDSVDDGDDDVGLPTLLQNIDDDNDEDTTNPVDNLPKGIPDGFSIIDHRTIPKSGFTTLQLENALSLESISRMKLTTMDVTVPVALLLLFPEQFATYTKARKESRRNKILVARGPTSPSGQEGGEVEVPNFDRDNLFVGKVADRV
jgi:hypothetical protein